MHLPSAPGAYADPPPQPPTPASSGSLTCVYPLSTCGMSFQCSRNMRSSMPTSCAQKQVINHKKSGRLQVAHKHATGWHCVWHAGTHHWDGRRLLCAPVVQRLELLSPPCGRLQLLLHVLLGVARALPNSNGQNASNVGICDHDVVAHLHVVFRHMPAQQCRAGFGHVHCS
jgi:hypothetical protein